MSPRRPSRTCGPRPNTSASRSSSSRSTGPGSADTYRADSAAELDAILPMLRHVPRVSVEEFIDGEEFTYDTICADGQVLFENICQYHPRPLMTKMHEWISPITLALRDLDAPALQGGRELGAAVLRRARVPGRVHPHGVVPQGRRRGGVRRDRRPAAGRPHGRRDELRHRRRPVLGLGAGHHARADLAAGRASATTPRASSSGPAAPAGSPTTRAWTGCWPSTASTSPRSSCCRSARRDGTGGPPRSPTAW